jgi:hypothetical protein
MVTVMRLVLGVSFALVVVALSASAVVARDPAVTITLTLKGHVPPDVGFYFTTFPGVGGEGFCVSRAERRQAVEEGSGDDSLPACASGVTYTRVQPMEKDGLSYEIGVYRPRTSHSIWRDMVAWDGRDHHRAYTYLFDLPATDAQAERVGAVAPASAADPPILLLAGAAAVAALVSWGWVGARRPRTAVSGRSTGTSARRAARTPR